MDTLTKPCFDVSALIRYQIIVEKSFSAAILTKPDDLDGKFNSNNSWFFVTGFYMDKGCNFNDLTHF